MNRPRYTYSIYGWLGLNSFSLKIQVSITSKTTHQPARTPSSLPIATLHLEHVTSHPPIRTQDGNRVMSDADTSYLGSGYGQGDGQTALITGSEGRRSGTPGGTRPGLPEPVHSADTLPSRPCQICVRFVGAVFVGC